MDSATQVLLGAVVGRAVSRRTGSAPLVIGAAAGLLPDLDFVAAPLVSAAEAFVTHRSATHSLVVAPFAALALAKLCASRFAAKTGMTAREWGWILWWVFATHIALDLCTTYGTQALWPLSREPFAWSVVFIVDPLYSVPMAAAVFYLWRKRNESVAPVASTASDSSDSTDALDASDASDAVGWVGVGVRKVAGMVLAGTTLYLCLGAALKMSALNDFRESRDFNRDELRGMSVQPAPLTIFQWQFLAAEKNGTTHVGWLSSFRGKESAEWEPVRIPTADEKQAERLASGTEEFARLSSFAKGLWRVEERDGEFYYVDLRFGVDATRPFAFRIARRNGDGEVELIPPPFKLREWTDADKMPEAWRRWRGRFF